MTITHKEIKSLANLASLSLSDSELKTYTLDLSQIVTFVSQINQLNTDGIPPTFQVIDQQNVWRSDEIEPLEADRTALLNLTPETLEYQIKVPKVL